MQKIYHCSRVAAIADVAQSFRNQVIFDLFCDHGKVGLTLSSSKEAQVYFNDIRNDLLEKLQREHNICLKFLNYGCAKELSFPEGSLIIMAGVGGRLMIECLESWKVRGILKELDFIFCPHYFELGLRDYLSCEGFIYGGTSIVTDRGRSYEIISASSTKKEGPTVPVFPDGIYNEQILRSRVKNLRDIRKRSDKQEQALEAYLALLEGKLL